MAKTASRTIRRAQTALDVLKADHGEVKKLFNQFEKQKKNEDDHGMQQTVQAICNALAIHAQIEEEIFYPALRAAPDADDPLDEAEVEHSHVKELVAQLEEAQPGDELYEARVKVLSEYVQHHVEEEESTLFTKARKADIDLVSLGDQLLERKQQLGGGEATPDVAALTGREASSRRRNAQRVTR